jgi:hypothetical protein
MKPSSVNLGNLSPVAAPSVTPPQRYIGRTMQAPLHFYPDPSVARFHYAQAFVAGAVALALLYPLFSAPDPGDPLSWLWDAAMIAAVTLALAVSGLAVRRARRIADARINKEPQLILDPFGIQVRGDFLWRAHRIAWSKIAAMDAVPHPDGVSIVIEGDLRPLGRKVDLTIDSQEPAELIALQLQQYARRPTLH